MSDTHYVEGLKADTDEIRKARTNKGVIYKLLIYGWEEGKDGQYPPYTAVYDFRTLEAAQDALKFFERGNLITKLIYERPSQ